MLRYFTSLLENVVSFGVKIRPWLVMEPSHQACVRVITSVLCQPVIAGTKLP